MDNKKRNEKILKLTCDLLEKMNFNVEKAFVEDTDDEENQALVGVTVENPAGLIGFRGRNLASIQFVLSLIVRSQIGEGIRVLLDVNNYRGEQKIRLENMTKALVEKVLSTGKPVALAAMSSYERRICHMALADIKGIVGESEGEGEDRHIVIKLAA